MLAVSDTVAIFSAFFGLISSLGVAWIAYLTLKLKQQQIETTKEVKEVKGDVHKIELATNSMKDQQVALASKLGLAEGEAKGRADQKAESEKKA